MSKTRFVTQVFAPVALLWAMSAVSVQAQDFSSGWYRLKAVASLDEACLEGNQAGSSVHDGAAFMDACQNVSGQLWRFVPAGNGYYRMHTQFRGDGECLEGNQASSSVHNGSAFLDTCQNVSGQLWKIIDATQSGSTVYQLKTQFRGDGECLQGDYGPGLNEYFAHGGNAYMASCERSTDKLWYIEPVSGGAQRSAGSNDVANAVAGIGAGGMPQPDRYYRLSTQFRGPDMNLDVHNGGDKNNMTQLAPRWEYSGQYWRFTPAGGGYYRLTTMFRGENMCLDVHNGGSKDNQVQLTDCANYSGQFWMLRNDGGWLRLSTQFRGPDMCLDIINGGPDNDQPQLTNCANYSGQLWNLEEAATGNSVGGDRHPAPVIDWSSEAEPEADEPFEEEPFEDEAYD